MINKIAQLILFSLLFSSYSMAREAKSIGTYTIDGNIDHAKMIYLYENSDETNFISDSVKPLNKHFHFKGIVNEIQSASIFIKMEDNTSIYIPFILEPGNIHITGKDLVLLPSGTVNNNLIYSLQGTKEFIDSSTIVIPYYKIANDMSEKLSILRDKAVPEKQDSLLKQLYTDSAEQAQIRIDSYMDWYAQKAINFMQEHPKSYTTVNYLRALFSGMNKDTVNSIYNNLGSDIQNSKLGIALKNEIDGDRLLPDESLAPNFKTKDINEKTISLNDFKGKYVLLDFWATWCGPCRASSPALIRIYKKYHEKGLEIIGIADDDQNIAGWKRAVKMDKTDIWHHVLRGTKLNKDDKRVDISELYSVSSYPTQYLIDKEGQIIGNFEASELDEVLQNLIK